MTTILNVLFVLPVMPKGILLLDGRGCGIRFGLDYLGHGVYPVGMETSRRQDLDKQNLRIHQLY